jgi:hypothetical protein
LLEKKRARRFTLRYIKFIKINCFILAIEGCYLIRGWGMPPEINKHFVN